MNLNIWPATSAVSHGSLLVNANVVVKTIAAASTQVDVLSKWPAGLTGVEVSQHRGSLERILVSTACGCAGVVQPVGTTLYLGLRAFLRGRPQRG